MEEDDRRYPIADYLRRMANPPQQGAMPEQHVDVPRGLASGEPFPFNPGPAQRGVLPAFYQSRLPPGPGPPPMGPPPMAPMPPAPPPYPTGPGIAQSQRGAGGGMDEFHSNTPGNIPGMNPHDWAAYNKQSPVEPDIVGDPRYEKPMGPAANYLREPKGQGIGGYKMELEPNGMPKAPPPPVSPELIMSVIQKAVPGIHPDEALKHLGPMAKILQEEVDKPFIHQVMIASGNSRVNTAAQKLADAETEGERKAAMADVLAALKERHENMLERQGDKKLEQGDKRLDLEQDTLTQRGQLGEGRLDLDRARLTQGASQFKSKEGRLDRSGDLEAARKQFVADPTQAHRDTYNEAKKKYDKGPINEDAAPIESVSGVGGASDPSPKAVAYLKANPADRDQFDQKYGAGAAAKALGE